MTDTLSMKNIPDCDFAKLVHDIAADSARVMITRHAKEKMQERNILRKHVDVCLQKGHVVESAHINIKGNWQATMTRRVAGLSIKAVVAVDMKTRVAVVTTWKEG